MVQNLLLFTDTIGKWVLDYDRQQLPPFDKYWILAIYLWKWHIIICQIFEINLG